MFQSKPKKVSISLLVLLQEHRNLVISIEIFLKMQKKGVCSKRRGQEEEYFSIVSMNTLMYSTEGSRRQGR